MPYVTYSIEDITDKRIRSIAQAKRMKLSAVVDAAIEMLAQQEEFADLDPLLHRPAKINLASIKGVSKGKAA